MEIARRQFLEDPSPKPNKFLKELFRPFLDSFNCFLDDLSKTVKNIEPLEVEIEGHRIKVFFEDAEIAVPCEGNNFSAYIYPRECRIKGTSYLGRLIARIGWCIDGVYQGTTSRSLGLVPVMLKSKRCSVNSLSPAELVRFGEEMNEQGGIFICAGIERMLRMIITQRRNYPLAMMRPTWKNKASGLTEYGVSLRSVDDLNNIVTNILHYISNATFTLSLSYRKQQYYMPFLVILRLLVTYTDFHIFSDVLRNDPDNSLWKESVKSMFSGLRGMKILSAEDAKRHLGEAFRVRLGLPEWYSDVEVADYLVKHCICVHLSEPVDKYNTLISMAHKLMALIDKKIIVESADALNNQELVLPGQIYQVVLRDKMVHWLNLVQYRIRRAFTDAKTSGPVTLANLNTALARCPDIGAQMEYFIKSGNIIAKNGLGLPQFSGWSIMAERINFMRYLAHFRSVHRGGYFTNAYTTRVRRLLPECWGFICPVHTPDGDPCGLLNHLTQSCQVVCRPVKVKEYLVVLEDFGVLTSIPGFTSSDTIEIHVDGRIVGRIDANRAVELYRELKKLKVKRRDQLEIIFIPKTELTSILPGIFIFSNPSRLSRPVLNVEFGTLEYIGPFEQVFTLISTSASEATPDTTHIEIDPSAILSVTAALTPFSDCNQSPRNMYQCQMMKQSMGIPLLAHRHRFANKLYRLLSVQSPICQSSVYQKLELDDYLLGVNAVVAVISYTGYDMEDAMILNKASAERGFGEGCIYKSAIINLEDIAKDRVLVFTCRETDRSFYENKLDIDGLPPIGRLMEQNAVFYSFRDLHTHEYSTKTYTYSEAGYIDDIVILSACSTGITKVNIRFRIPRNPIVGDKFSSRHGQKGILSILWPQEDMPFTEDGIIPDIIFNPHGFPSRMTIGMLVESMASKVGAATGRFFDCSPFKSSNTSLVDFFGEQLAAVGYNYYGSDRMYSGTNGEELEVNIFTGIVYYQRLRHMVADKFQARSSGAVDPLTHQPVGGRNRGGGVRFGEMERDALISHGCSYLLQDRLFDCSDKSQAFVCAKCGDLLATKLDLNRTFNPLVEFQPSSVTHNKNPNQFTCLLCNSSAHIKCVYIPYAFRYLLVELASMNIRVKLNL